MKVTEGFTIACHHQGLLSQHVPICEVSHHEWESVTLVTMSDSRFSKPSDENVEAKKKP